MVLASRTWCPLGRFSSYLPKRIPYWEHTNCPRASLETVLLACTSYTQLHRWQVFTPRGVSCCAMEKGALSPVDRHMVPSGHAASPVDGSAHALPLPTCRCHRHLRRAR